MPNFDPYHKWLAIPPQEQPPNHYRLLGVQLFESDPDVIASAADQRMAKIRSFQTGTHADLSQQILNELAAARVCLFNPEKKAESIRHSQYARTATARSGDTTDGTAGCQDGLRPRHLQKHKGHTIMDAVGGCGCWRVGGGGASRIGC